MVNSVLEKFEEIQLQDTENELTDYQQASQTNQSIVGEAIPSDILLGSVRDGRFRVETPIKVRFSEDKDAIVAEAIDFNEFGFGSNQIEALSDIQSTIVELFLTLDEDKDRLGKDLQLLRKKLNEHISLHTP